MILMRIFRIRAIFRNYLDSSPRWEYLGNLAANESLDSGRLQPGDILTTENNVHTIIYLGNALVRQAYPNSTANTLKLITLWRSIRTWRRTRLIRVLTVIRLGFTATRVNLEPLTIGMSISGDTWVGDGSWDLGNN